MRIDPSGKIYVTCGACPQGQGMETIFAQIVADLWKVTPEDVVLSFADTAAIAIGFGTMASRSTVTLSARDASGERDVCATRFSRSPPICSNARPADLELRDGGVGVVGVPGATIEPVPGSRRPRARAGRTRARPGSTPGLEEIVYWQPPTVTWSYAVHVAIVEVDRDTGRVTHRKLCGRA